MITFSTQEDLQFNIKNNKTTFFSDTFIYDFTFFVKVASNYNINNVTVYKNEKEYEDVIVTVLSNNEIKIMEKKCVSTGHYNYKVKVVMTGGTVFIDDFYLKVTNVKTIDDLKIIFATYGLHENFNYLNLIVNVSSEKNIIDTVEFYKYDWQKKWIYLGEAEKNIVGNYVYSDLIFDINEKLNDTILYKTKIICTSGLIKEKIISTQINENSFSVNTISIANTKSNEWYIYGGICGKVNNVNSFTHNQIFEFLINKQITQNLSLKFKDYEIYAEQFTSKIPLKYIKNPTNINPNIIIFEGICKITKEQRITRGNFYIKLICGDDIKIEWNVNCKNSWFNHMSDLTVNNIIKYSYNQYKLSDRVYENILLSNNNLTGFFTYNEEMKFIQDNFTEQYIPINNLKDRFDKADCVLYNNMNYYFINYNELGIHIVKYDGINLFNDDYEITLNDNIIEYLRSNWATILDTTDNVYLNFINSDNTSKLEFVTLKDKNLDIVDCSSIVTSVYNEMRINIKNFLNSLPVINKNGNLYTLNFDINTINLESKSFYSMQRDNFIQQNTMQEFKYQINLPTKISFKNITSGIITTFNTILYLNSYASVLINKNGYNIEMQKYDFEINHDNLNFIFNDTLKNQNPINIMEKLNNKYYIKFENSLSTKNKEDYGEYKKAIIYNQSNSIYTLTPLDCYGNDTTKSTFKYSDICNLRVLLQDTSTIWIMRYFNNKILVSIIDIKLEKQIKQFYLYSKLFFNSLYTYVERQLENFEQQLISIYDNDKVKRTMQIYTISNYNDLDVCNIISKPLPMKKIASIDCSGNYYSHYLDYTTEWTLNIKNKLKYLLDIDIVERF